MTLRVRSYQNEIDKEALKYYFGLDDELHHILSSISQDSFIKDAIKRFYGLRIVRQEPWECLASYVCATNTNIPQIEAMLECICNRFGHKAHPQENYYTFPSPSALARAGLDELKACGLGYRAIFVKEIAKKVHLGDISLEALARLDYHRARQRLLAKSKGKKVLLGVGPKVADCVLLFSMNKLEAFPIDVWVLKAVVSFYHRLFDKSFITELRKKLYRRPRSLSFKEYDIIAERMREYFGPFAGYAQEYIYANIRTLAQKGLL